MNVLHMQLSGGFGGIATLSRTINQYSEDNNFFAFLFEGGCIADELQLNSAGVYVLNSPHWSASKAKKQYRQICEENNIDVIVSHTGCFLEFQIIVFLKKKLPHLKVIMYEHCDMNDVMGTGVKKIINTFLYKRAFKIADAGVAISDFVKETAIQVDSRFPEKIHVIYNGIDVDRFHFVKRDRGRIMRLIYVGRVVPEKGCKLLVEAISRLPEDVAVKATVVGEGTDFNECVSLTEKLHVSEKIEFLGSRNDVPELLASADVFVHPVICEEGFGITLAEALATGLPCLAFKKGAVAELIEDGVNGLYTDEVSADGFAKLITNMYNLFCVCEIENMSYNAAESGKKYDIQNTVKQLRAIYLK